MATRKIRSGNDGFFFKGSVVGEIDDDGKVFDKDKHYVGRLDSDGKFLTPDGAFFEKEQFIIKDGRIYDDKGFITYGKQIGTIDANGSIKDMNKSTVAVVEPRNTREHSFLPKTPTGGIDIGETLGIIAVGFFPVVFAIGSFLLIPAQLGSSSISYGSKMGIVLTIAVSALCAVIYFFVSIKLDSMKYSKNLGICFTANWAITSIFSFIYSWYLENGFEGFDLFIMIISTPLMTVGVCLLCSAISALFSTIRDW